ncbi:MAG: hypothetical protein WAW06_08890 [bacterium]
MLLWILAGLLLSSTALAYLEGARSSEDPSSVNGIVRFRGVYHNVNKLLLHSSNMGFFGDWNSDQNAPSGEWPAGSGVEWLFAAGLWVGGVLLDEARRPDTLVTAAVYQLEFYPKADLRDIVYIASEGMSGGGRVQDDDNDGRLDEDALDGYDNDLDGAVDEDFAAISQQMFTSVFYDTSMSMNRSRTEDFHGPLGLEVRQESYAWTSQALENFIGVEYKVTNINDSTIYNAYVAFMVDSDIGNARVYPQAYSDDMASYVDTILVRTEVNAAGAEENVNYHVTMGYMWDFPGGQDGNVRGYFGVMFMGHTTDQSGRLAPSEVGIHMFKQWSSGEEDPENDRERYRYMRGNSDTEKTIDPNTLRAADYRFLVSAGRFAAIPPDSTLIFQVAFVAGATFDDFLENAANAQKVYNGGSIMGPGGVAIDVHWLGSSPPPPPRQRLIAGDNRVMIEWDDYSETTPDPLQRVYDFAGYRIWKAVGWRHESAVPAAEQWRLIEHYSKQDLPQVDTGLIGVGKYRYVDGDVHNGLPYWYAVTAFDDGSAEKVVNANTGTMDSIPRYGSYSQAMQVVYPRGTPAVVDGKVRIVPNPYPGMSESVRTSGRAVGDMVEYEGDPSGRRVRFVNLPRRATVRVFSLAGDLVWSGYFEDPLDAMGEPPGWNLVSRNNQEIVSGTYIVHVQSPVGEEVTRLVVVR